MILEEFILYLMCFVSVISFWLLMPREKQRYAQVAFLFNQFSTWFLGLFVANLKLIEYPIRLFPTVSGTSFTFEFFAYPVISAFFNVYYPESKGRLFKFLYYASICSSITVLELIFENYTQLIRYLNWTGYHTWTSVLITLYLSRLYYKWFFKVS